MSLLTRPVARLQHCPHSGQYEEEVVRLIRATSAATSCSSRTMQTSRSSELNVHTQNFFKAHRVPLSAPHQCEHHVVQRCTLTAPPYTWNGMPHRKGVHTMIGCPHYTRSCCLFFVELPAVLVDQPDMLLLTLSLALTSLCLLRHFHTV